LLRSDFDINVSAVFVVVSHIREQDKKKRDTENSERNKNPLRKIISRRCDFADDDVSLHDRLDKRMTAVGTRRSRRRDFVGAFGTNY
jgi:hypothetical protein